MSEHAEQRRAFGEHPVNCTYCCGQRKLMSTEGSMDPCFACGATGKHYLNQYDIQHRLPGLLEERPVAAHQNQGWRKWDHHFDFREAFTIEELNEDGSCVLKLKAPIHFIKIDLLLNVPEKE